MEKRFIPNTNNKYEIYEDGRVYTHFHKKFLSPDLHDGYYRYRLTMSDGKLKNKFAHRLVAESFIDNPEDHPVVNHIDGNKLNNVILNLEWCTVSHNCQHAYDTGLRPIYTGEDNYHAKLTYDVVEEIKQDISDGMIYEDISDKHNISPATISMIKNGKRWTDEKITVTSTANSGSNNPQSKLDEEKVKEIFELLKQKKPQTQIAKLYGVHKGLISSIARRKSWTHVETDYVYEHVTNKVDLSVYPKVIECFETSGLTRKQVAEKFGISKSMVEKILRTRNS